MHEPIRESAYKVVRMIASPLRFFAVAMILLGAIIICLSCKSTLPPEQTAQIIYVAFIALIAILVIVTLLVLLAPKKLTFDQEAHLTVLREKLGDHELSTSYFSGTLPKTPPKYALMNEEKGDI